MENLEDYQEFVLLEKMKKFQVSYYDFYTNEWLTQWKIGPDENSYLPSAVHIRIEFENNRNQLIKTEMNIPVHQQFILPIKR